ncbi:hypothetical protein GGI07_002600 [Coemansia sp. Benny D115]|nr:hypothetical protein GGI07_002600 [Coemansia sp. Benny D115]
MATVRSFSAAMLKHTTVVRPKDFYEVKFVNGFWRPSSVSLRRQADIRKACLISSIDPVSIGLPELQKKKRLQKKPAKGHKQQRLYASKQAAIQKNLDEMPEKIRKWKDDLVKEKAKTKSSLPF